MEIEWNLLLRLLVAGLLGGLVGFEREFRAKEAGLRTHFLVALGSALFMLISQFAFNGHFDAARVAAQVVTGIGFIGAGVIIFQKNAVRGITTASGIWVVGAIGLASGAGMYFIASMATLLALVCLETMHFLTRHYGEKSLELTISPVTSEKLLEIMKAIKAAGIDIHSFSVTDSVARISIHMRQSKLEEAMTSILEVAKGLTVEIS